jgi:NADP-dependent 3-hydroxy acid dehydrogenase YdfG
VGNRLEGRRVLVTGASSGIGAAIAEAIAADGGRVALLARRAEVLEDLAARTGGIAVPADVVDATATRDAVDRAAAELGGLDGLVNAAGVLRAGAVADTDPADWQLTFDVNVRGLLHATQPAMAHLRDAGRGSDVVNVSSMSGRRLGSPEMGVYAASKAAVHTISEGLRRELADDGVRVTVVSPGIVRTDIFGDDDTGRAADLRDKAEEIGLEPDDVARAVVNVLAAPPHVVHVEVAMLSVDQ